MFIVQMLGGLKSFFFFTITAKWILRKGGYKEELIVGFADRIAGKKFKAKIIHLK